MQFFSVKQISSILHVNDETVRRWIREGKLSAEKGSGRQGSRVNSEQLKNFIEEHRVYTSAETESLLQLSPSIANVISGSAIAASALGASALAGSTLAATVVGGPLFSALLIGLGAKKAIAKFRDQKIDTTALKVELLEQKMALIQKKSDICDELSKLQNQISLIDAEMETLDYLIQTATHEEED